MDNTKIFNISEIITIVMEEVKVEESKKMYNIDYECNYPKVIYDKLDSLGEIEFKEVTNIVEQITRKILNIKNGELNELNRCHEEIIYMVKKDLEKYIID